MSRNNQGLANGRWKHTPRLSTKQVLEMRHRVTYGDLRGKSLKTIGHAYFVGTGETALALGGLGRYSSYPVENIVTDRKFLLNCVPNTQVDVTQRVIFMKENPEVEQLVIQQAQAIEEDVVEYEPKETNVVVSTEEITDITEPTGATGTAGAGGAGEAEEPRRRRGGFQPRKDIPAEVISQIRADREAGLSFPRLVRKYGYSHAMIDRILRGSGRFGKIVPVQPPSPTSPAPTAPAGTDAEELLAQVLRVAAPRLGWAKIPQEPELSTIIQQLEAVHELMGEQLTLLKSWAQLLREENSSV